MNDKNLEERPTGMPGTASPVYKMIPFQYFPSPTKYYRNNLMQFEPTDSIPNRETTAVQNPGNNSMILKTQIQQHSPMPMDLSLAMELEENVMECTKPPKDWSKWSVLLSDSSRAPFATISTQSKQFQATSASSLANFSNSMSNLIETTRVTNFEPINRSKKKNSDSSPGHNSGSITNSLIVDSADSKTSLPSQQNGMSLRNGSKIPGIIEQGIGNDLQIVSSLDQPNVVALGESSFSSLSVEAPKEPIIGKILESNMEPFPSKVETLPSKMSILSAGVKSANQSVLSEKDNFELIDLSSQTKDNLNSTFLSGTQSKKVDGLTNEKSGVIRNEKNPKPGKTKLVLTSEQFLKKLRAQLDPISLDPGFFSTFEGTRKRIIENSSEFVSKNIKRPRFQLIQNTIENSTEISKNFDENNKASNENGQIIQCDELEIVLPEDTTNPLDWGYDQVCDFIQLNEPQTVETEVFVNICHKNFVGGNQLFKLVDPKCDFALKEFGKIPSNQIIRISYILKKLAAKLNLKLR